MKKGYWYITATALFFSTAEIATKFISHSLDPLQITFLRFLIGGLFLLPFAIVDMRKRQLRLAAKDWLALAGLGALGISLSMPLFQLAVQVAKAGKVAVVFSTNTLFTAVFAVWLLKEGFTKLTAVALGLGALGVVAMLNPFAGMPDALGMALTLAAAALFSLYGVLGAGFSRRFGGFVLNSFTFLMGSALLIIPMAVLHTPVFHGVSWDNLPVLLYVCLGVTGLGYLFYFAAMRETSAIETSAVFFIKPALAPMLAWLVLGEAPMPTTVLGIVLITIGAFVLFWRKKRTTKKA